MYSPGDMGRMRELLDDRQYGTEDIRQECRYRRGATLSRRNGYRRGRRQVLRRRLFRPRDGFNDIDAYSSFDKAAERLEKRLRRYKRRLKDHKKHPTREEREAASFVIEAPDEDAEVADDWAPAIIAETRAPIATMSVSNAVMELDMTDAPVVVFRNTSHGGINVVYRRADGHFGWVDPTLAEASR